MDQDIFYIPSAVCVGSRWGIVEADRGVSLKIVAVIPILLAVEPTTMLAIVIAVISVGTSLSAPAGRIFAVLVASSAFETTLFRVGFSAITVGLPFTA